MVKSWAENHRQLIRKNKNSTPPWEIMPLGWGGGTLHSNPYGKEEPSLPIAYTLVICSWL